MNFLKYVMGSILLMDEAGDKGGGGGSGGNKDIDELKSQNAALLARLDALEKKGKPDPEDPSLADKVRKEREDREKAAGSQKNMESAVEFNLSSKDFVKLNKGLVPESVESLFAQAEKETYDSAVDKANAIKAGIVQEFFAVQANHDLLTSGQKNELDQFLKLTKNVKQEKAANIYSMIFEPTLESLRKIEKAKQVHSGGKDQTDGEKAIAEKLLKLGKQRYLGEK